MKACYVCTHTERGDFAADRSGRKRVILTILAMVLCFAFMPAVALHPFR
jgi:hypothetical protein